ncbi:tRNA lysidine(34) synthetase TilS [Roseovarius sp. S4756]|uniref:tRNA lysidine(34) synthetase TilS n=1 Tax=Roseovarius maritimus TaxID=3342637 RepID=UPI0037263072
MTQDAGADLRALIPAHFQDDTSPLGIAVSGGSDSMALLYLMADWGRAPLRCVTVDHRLRPEAADEAVQVAQVCVGLGIPHETLVWDGWNGQGNLPAAARAARYALMADWAARHALAGIALGHTRDDVAETLLMRLARRAGLDGLAAMQARRAAHGTVLHRPLLTAGRADLRAYLAQRGIRWNDDPSNDDPRYRRTQARRALAALAPVGIDAAALAEVAAHLAEARATLGHYASLEAKRIVQLDQGDLLLDVPGFAALRPDIARRILGAAIGWIAGPEVRLRGPDVTRLMQAIADGQGGTLAGCRITQNQRQIRLAREFAAVEGLRADPGAAWDGRWRLIGPPAPGAHIAALGPEGRAICPDWRDSGLPAHSIDASPALWRGGALLAAPLTRYPADYRAEPCCALSDLHAALLSH